MAFLSSVRNTYIRGELVFIIDLLLSVGVSLLVLLGVDALLEETLLSPRLLAVYLSASFVASVLFLFFTRTYRIIIRHLSVYDLIPFAIFSIGKCVVLLIVLSLFGFFSRWTVLIIVIDLLVTILILLGIRVSMILGYSVFMRNHQDMCKKQQLLVYGTSDKSVAIIPRLQNSTYYCVRGFIERSVRKN